MKKLKDLKTPLMELTIEEATKLVEKVRNSRLGMSGFLRKEEAVVEKDVEEPDEA